MDELSQKNLDQLWLKNSKTMDRSISDFKVTNNSRINKHSPRNFRYFEIVF